MKYIRSKGFTIVELLIVVALIGILSAVALPNYTKSLVKSSRVDATKMLTEIMAQQQRYVARNRTYTIDLGATGLGYVNAAAGDVLTPEGYYLISADPCGNAPINVCVVLTAKPVVGQRQERDGDFTISSRGGKTWNGLSGWDHRGFGVNAPGGTGAVAGQ